MDLRIITKFNPVGHPITGVPDFWETGSKVSESGRFIQNPVWYNQVPAWA